MVAKTEGERYDFRHKPVVPKDAQSRGWNGRCQARLPSGTVCDRGVNFVHYETNGGRSFETIDGHWRHNPRPYTNY